MNASGIASTRVAIFISGGGSNMVQLVCSMQENGYAQPVLVLANDPKAAGLEKAKALGIPTVIVDHRFYGHDRTSFEAALREKVALYAPDIICLAGFMRILTTDFIKCFENRILNIHPSLLPKYPGLHTHRRVLENGDDITGCSVHIVTAKLDAGPILGQGRIRVLQNDTEASLAARVLGVEHELYPMVLRHFVCGKRDILLIERLC